MKWVIYAGLGIAAVIALVVIVGYLLPKGHTATRKIRLGKPPEEVFVLIAGPQDWREGIRYEALQDGKWRETDSRGDTITYERVETIAPRRIVNRIADPKLPFGGSWVYELTPSGNGTELRITENGEVYNPIFRFVSKFVMGHTATIDGYLRAVAKRFGDAALIEDVGNA